MSVFPHALSDPVDIGSVSVFDRGRNDLWDVVWMILLYEIRQSVDDWRSRLDHHEYFLVVLHFALPKIDGCDLRDHIDTRSKFLGHWKFKQRTVQTFSKPVYSNFWPIPLANLLATSFDGAVTNTIEYGVVLEVVDIVTDLERRNGATDAVDDNTPAIKLSTVTRLQPTIALRGNMIWEADNIRNWPLTEKLEINRLSSNIHRHEGTQGSRQAKAEPQATA